MVSVRARTRSSTAGSAGGASTAAAQLPRSRQIRRAAAQVGPLAHGFQVSTSRGVHIARAWTAPRLDLAGRAVQERAAPRVSAMLSAAARRIEPAQPKHARRWPALAAGTAVLAGGAAAIALVSRRGASPAILRGRRETSDGNGETAAGNGETAAGADTARADADATDISKHAGTS